MNPRRTDPCFVQASSDLTIYVTFCPFFTEARVEFQGVKLFSGWNPRKGRTAFRPIARPFVIGAEAISIAPGRCRHPFPGEIAQKRGHNGEQHR